EPAAPGLRGRLADRGRPGGRSGARRRRARARTRVRRPDRRLLLHRHGPGREPGGVLVRAADQSEGSAPGRLSKALCRRFGGEMPSARATEPPLAPTPSTPPFPRTSGTASCPHPGEKCGFSLPAFSFALPSLVAAHRHTNPETTWS